MQLKFVKIYDAGLEGKFALWGRTETRENYVGRHAVAIGVGCIYESQRGWLVIEGRRGSYDLVSVWPTREEAERRLYERAPTGTARA